MKKDVLNIEVCNPTNERLETNLFTPGSLNKATVYEKTGLLYDSSGGAANGDQLPVSTLNGEFIDSQRNIYYAGTNGGGIWIFDVAQDTGSIIDTGTSVNGDALQNDIIGHIVKDISGNILYLESNDQIWVYNVNTNTGKVYSTTTGVSSGVNLPGIVNSLMYDAANNYLWVTGSTFLWRLDIDTNEGTNMTTVTTGDNFPGAGVSIVYNETYNFLFVGTFTHGVYRYDISLDDGKIYDTTGGATNGDQLPDDQIGYQIGQKGSTIYVPSNNGVWLYNILTDTGSIINTSTYVVGEPLDDDNIRTCFYSPETKKLYIGTLTSLWAYTIGSNLGEILKTVLSGDERPAGRSNYIYYDRNTLWEASSNGAWRYNEYEYSQISIESNSQSSISYSYITNDVQQSPIKILKIILTSDNDRQKYNSLTHIIETIAGSDVQYTVHFSNYVNPLLPFKQVHVDLEEPLAIDYEQFLRITIEANTCINLLFEYEQQSPASLMEHLSPDEKDILPIYYEETKDSKLIKTVSLNKSEKVSMIPKPEFKWLPPWVVMAIISILLQFKSKK